MSRDEEVVFEEQYEEIPSFREDNGDKQNIRLISDGWEPSKGVYKIEYKIPDMSKLKERGIEQENEENIGIDLHILGGGMTGKSVSVNILEFESEQQVQYFLRGIDS